MADFKKEFRSTPDHGGEGSERFDELTEDQINQQQIVKQKR